MSQFTFIRSKKQIRLHKIYGSLFLILYLCMFYLLHAASQLESILLFGKIAMEAGDLNVIIMQIQIVALIGFITNSTISRRFLIASLMNAVFFVFSLYAIVARQVYGAAPGLLLSLSIYIIILIVQKYDDRVINSFSDLEKNRGLLHEMVHFDVLTGLPNRKMITDRINCLIHQFHQCNDEKDGFSIIFIDLDNFKKVNDVYGHTVGDKFLVQIAKSLNDCVHKCDILGRLGGDEFILIVPRKMNQGELYQYVDGIREGLAHTLSLEDFRFSIHASFGISTYPADAKNADDLLKYADAAMYKAKGRGKDKVQFFNPSLYQSLMSRFAFEQSLKTAISNQELSLNFQPQYAAGDRTLRGFEALICWSSPIHGQVGPDRFIPIAEESGLIIPIGEWAFQKSCKKLRQASECPGCRDLIMSVHVSFVQISDSNFLPMIDRILRETGANPANLEIEISESAFIASPEYVTDILYQVKQHGIRIVLDSFGTGYSSLNCLQVLPIDTLKIGKNLVDRIHENDGDGGGDGNDGNEAIVGPLIDLIHRLGYHIVVEDVKNERQREILAEYTCDYVQGSLWGSPLREQELDLYLQQKNA